MPFLAGVCRKSGMKMAVMLHNRTGADPTVVQTVARGLREMGHFGPVALRADGEAALLETLTAVATGRKSRTLVEKTQRGDSKGAGRAERAIRSIEEMVRVLKSDLEKRVCRGLDAGHPLMEWILRHAVDLLNKRQVGRDQRTPHERLRGRTYRGELTRFGSQVMHRLNGKVVGGALVDRWIPGHWVGKTASEEHLVMLRTGEVVRARAVRPTDDSPDVEALSRIG